MDRLSLPVIITRAQPGADETALRVQEIGLQAIRSPVLRVQNDASMALPDLGSISGLVFTSANGVRAFADRASDRSHTAWCVGPATAASAREADFRDVQESAGNAIDLAHFIATQSRPTKAPLLHVANAAAKGDLKSTLEDLGFSILFSPLYAMQPTERLSEDAQHVLQSSAPALALIHSAKGAAQFAELIQGFDLSAVSLVGISDPAIAPLASMTFQQIQIAPAPNEDGLFAALATAIATLSA